MVRTEEPPLGVSLRLPTGEVSADALVVLVANNPYGPQPMERMARRSLDTGMLQVSVLRARTGAQIAAFIARMGSSRGGDPSSGAEWTTPELTVQAPAGEVRAAIDGDATVLSAPLEFRSWPGALRVLVPSARRRSRPIELLAPLHWRTMSDVWKLAIAR
jgi:diacylglycerol kinase family enzyme